MSASQEKRKRQEERAEGTEKKQIQRKKSQAAQKRNKIIKAVTAVVVVVLLVLLVVSNSTLFYSGINALHLGSWSFKTAEFNYFYNQIYYNTYSNLSSSYGDYAYLFLDPSKPLDKQEYEEGKTWADFFEEQALSRMQSVAALYDEGQREGYVLSEEGTAEIESTMTTLRSQALDAGFGSLNDFLARNYSKGFNEKMFKNLVEKEIYSQYYGQELLDRQTFTDEELQARYDESQNEYNLITYCRYFVSASNYTAEGVTEDAALSSAYSAATELSAARTEDVFADIVKQIAPESEKEQYSTIESVRTLNAAPSNIDSAYSEWLTSPDRAYGDTTIIDGDGGYNVLLYVYSNDNQYNLQSFRHVLFNIEADPDLGEITPAAITEAELKAKAALELWKEDPTEENFALIAEEQSQDPGSNSNGGLYEDIQMGYLVPEIENWLFDPARVPGDTSIIYVKSVNYSGWHVVYYVGEGEQYNLRIAENLMKTEWFSNWEEERVAQYPVKKTIAFWFAK